MSDPDHVDVLVIGGGVAGASTGMLLSRQRPGCAVRVLESSTEFDRKVGEATVEVSGYFLAHVLKLHKKLAEDHLFKHGLRYWFTDGQSRPLEQMTEVGAITQPSLPSFQVDRARLDQTVLDEAEACGVEVLRPAKVVDVSHAWPTSRVVYEIDGERHECTARWVIDATGRRAFLSRRQGLLEAFEGQRTASLWGHWRGTLDMDGACSQGTDPRSPRLAQVKSSRMLATNHFCGYGWWAWVIPLSNGDTSIGVVWDEQLFEPDAGASSRETYERFVRSQDGLGELVRHAELLDGVTLRRNLAYRSSRYMDRGWALVGDAASFLDPHYSPGLDHMAMSVYATTRLVSEELASRDEGGAAFDLVSAIEIHNERFVRSVDRWFEALYRDKYEIFGDAELTATAFYLDTAMYFLGVVYPIYRDPEELRVPTLGSAGLEATIAYRLLRLSNRRLVHLARQRRARGTYGRRNVGWGSYVEDFGSGRRTMTPAHWKGIRMWIGAELHGLWTALGTGRGARTHPVTSVRRPESKLEFQRPAQDA